MGLVKAQLEEMTTRVMLPVQFNPQTLRVSYRTSGTSGTQVPAGSTAQQGVTAQNTGSSASLSLELFFEKRQAQGGGGGAGASAGSGGGVSASASAGISAGIGASVSAGAGFSAGAAVGTTPLTLAQSGDTLQSLTARAGVDWKAVASAN